MLHALLQVSQVCVLAVTGVWLVFESKEDVELWTCSNTFCRHSFIYLSSSFGSRLAFFRSLSQNVLLNFYSGFHLKKVRNTRDGFNLCVQCLLAHSCWLTENIPALIQALVSSNEGNDDFVPVRPVCSGNDAFPNVRLELSCLRVEMCGFLNFYLFIFLEQTSFYQYICKGNTWMDSSSQHCFCVLFRPLSRKD